MKIQTQARSDTMAKLQDKEIHYAFNGVGLVFLIVFVWLICLTI